MTARVIERAFSVEAQEPCLEAIAREQLPRVERLLRRILGPRDDMEDLVQTVFLELCRSWPRYRGDSRPSTFVGGIAVMVARRAMRPRALARHRAPLDEGAMPSRCQDIEEHVAARQDLRLLRSALEGVSPQKRIAFSLWAFEGIDVADIAKMMNASVAATRSRIWYAQKALKRRAVADPALAAILGGQR